MPARLAARRGSQILGLYDSHDSLIGFDHYSFATAAAGLIKILGVADVVAGVFEIFGFVLLKDLVRLFHVVYDELGFGEGNG